jgi:hypothetical protein
MKFLALTILISFRYFIVIFYYYLVEIKNLCSFAEFVAECFDANFQVK